MLFQWGRFKSAAGLDLDFKIECDALTNDDWDCIARACLPNLPKFKAVVPVPRGGIPLARAFEPHITPDAQVTLIVDDVWTTGQSFMEVAKTIDCWAGCVAFCRTYLPPGVLAFMRLDTLPKGLRIVSQTGSQSSFRQGDGMTKQPKTHWNYRVVRRHNKHGSWLEITEVYYTNGKPWAFASDLTAPHVSGDDLEDDERRLNDLRLTLNRMKEALSKPILDENEDFRE